MSAHKEIYFGAYAQIKTEIPLWKLLEGSKFDEHLSQVSNCGGNTDQSQTNSIIAIGNLGNEPKCSESIDSDGGIYELPKDVNRITGEFVLFYEKVLNEICEKVGANNVSVGFGLIVYYS